VGTASALRTAVAIAKFVPMFSRDQWRAFMDSPVAEWSMFAVGVMLLILAPVVGVLPGPGGIIVAGIGLALVLKTSMWAKRRYVKFKRWQPKAGRWTDWALRRPSAKRREAIRKVDAEPDSIMKRGRCD
jgi:hypothetical protein